MRSFNFVGAMSMTISAVLLTVLLVSSPVQAHVVLVDPVPRTSDNNLRNDPCGGKPAGASVATYTAGTNIEITIDLSVQHTRSLHAVISYDNFATRTTLAMIPTSGSGIYKMTVPLPMQPLGSAVLQVTHGSYVSCADISLSEGESFVINAGLNDAWYFPGTAGQGFLIIVFPDIQQMFLAWFTFDTERPPEDVTAFLGEPGHRWLTAQGPYDGDTATLTILVTEGGVFDASSPAASTDPAGDGTISIEFTDCTEGLVNYEITSLGISGKIPIQRISLDNVILCVSL
jgi:hypothetical protein